MALDKNFQNKFLLVKFSKIRLPKSDAWQIAGLGLASGKANVLAVGQPVILLSLFVVSLG